MDESVVRQLTVEPFRALCAEISILNTTRSSLYIVDIWVKGVLAT